MEFATPAAIIGGLFCVLNLLLMLGLLKRLRDQQNLITSIRAPQNIKIGDEVGEFAAETVDGEPLTLEQIDDDTVVAFFSPSCEPCLEKIPPFVRYSQGLPGGRRPLVTVIGDPRESAPLVAQLTAVARVVVEERDGPVARAFQVSAFPTVLRVAHDPLGRVVVRDHQVDLEPRVGTAR